MTTGTSSGLVCSPKRGQARHGGGRAASRSADGRFVALDPESRSGHLGSSDTVSEISAENGIEETQLFAFQILTSPLVGFLPQVAVQFCPFIILAVAIEVHGEKMVQGHCQFGQILVTVLPSVEGTVVGVLNGGDAVSLGDEKVLTEGRPLAVFHRDLGFK